MLLSMASALDRFKASPKKGGFRSCGIPLKQEMNTMALFPQATDFSLDPGQTLYIIRYNERKGSKRPNSNCIQCLITLRSTSVVL